MKPLTRKELDKLTCSHADHDAEACIGSGGLYFHSRCHPGCGCEVYYEDGVLELKCMKCRDIVVKISVHP